MAFSISALYRESDINHDVRKCCSGENQGGGVAIQAWHLKRSLPSINMVSDVEAVPDGICLTEALWLTNAQDLEAHIERWAKLPAIKILINNDVSILRLNRAITEQILDAADLVVTTSKYAQQLLSFYGEVHLLYDPLDVDIFMPLVKTRSVYSAGHISVHKNISMVTDIFNALGASFQKNYFGSSALWGSVDDKSKELQTNLEAAADNVLGNIAYIDLSSHYGRQWAFIVDSRYDFSSFSMMEAMLCGCWIFAGDHLLYGERPCLRFKTAEEASEMIEKQMADTPPQSGIINEEARQHIIDRNSYDAFRVSLKALIGDFYIGI